MTKTQKEIVNKALDFMLNVCQTQGRLLSRSEIYGDGTMFKGLTLDGFIAVYESLKEALELKAEGVKK